MNKKFKIVSESVDKAKAMRIAKQYDVDGGALMLILFAIGAIAIYIYLIITSVKAQIKYSLPSRVRTDINNLLFDNVGKTSEDIVKKSFGKLEPEVHSAMVALVFEALCGWTLYAMSEGAVYKLIWEAYFKYYILPEDKEDVLNLFYRAVGNYFFNRFVVLSGDLTGSKIDISTVTEVIISYRT